jgi:hypothetical protein
LRGPDGAVGIRNGPACRSGDTIKIQSYDWSVRSSSLRLRDCVFDVPAKSSDHAALFAILGSFIMSAGN